MYNRQSSSRSRSKAGSRHSSSRGYHRQSSLGGRRRRAGKQPIEAVAKRREEGGGRGRENGNLHLGNGREGIGNILSNRKKERDPRLGAQKERCHLKYSNGVANAKRTQRSNSSKLGGKSAALLLLKKTSQRAESTLGIIEIRTNGKGGPYDFAIGGAYKIEIKLHSRGTAIRLSGSTC